MLARGLENGYDLMMSRESKFMQPLRRAGSESSGADALEQAAFLASVKQGLAELDSGLYVSGAEIEVWAESLFTGNELPVPSVRQRIRP